MHPHVVNSVEMKAFEIESLSITYGPLCDCSSECRGRSDSKVQSRGHDGRPIVDVFDMAVWGSAFNQWYLKGCGVFKIKKTNLFFCL